MLFNAILLLLNVTLFTVLSYRMWVVRRLEKAYEFKHDTINSIAPDVLRNLQRSRRR